MGRGGRSQAITEAKNLLYGKRQSLVRTSSAPSSSEPVSFQGLSQERYVDNLIKLTASLGLSKPLTLSEQKQLCQGIGASPIDGQIRINIKQSHGHRLRLVINTNGKDNGIGAYYSEDISDIPAATITLEAGDRLGGPVAIRIDELGHELKKLGAKRFAYKADPGQVVRRLQQDDPIEFDDGYSVLNSKSRGDWSRARGQAKRLIHRAYDEELISAEEEASLAGRMDSLNPGDDVIARFAETSAGRSVISSATDLYITEELNK